MGRTQPQLALAKASVEELRKKTRAAQERKDYFVRYLHELWKDNRQGKVSKKFCLETEYKKLDGKTIREWIVYYDNYLKECRVLIKKNQKNTAKKYFLTIFISVVIIGLLAFSFYQFQPSLTGFFVQEPSPETISRANITTEITTHASAVLDQPVKWTKTISLDIPSGITLTLPKSSEKINVFSISYSEQEGALQEKMSPSQEEPLASDKIKIEKDTGGFFGFLGRLTGGAVGVSTKEIQISINDTSTEYEIKYETPAPKITLEENIEKGKRIKISSPENIHYENVLAFTTLSENLNIKDISQIKIHWLEEDSYITPSSVKDIDNNGIYDYVEFIVPSLSEQTFDITIKVLNVQSYPMVGGTWTVRFNTTGTADLKISTINGTSFTEDLKFLEVKCGDKILNYEWQDDSVLIQDYSCENQTGFETSKVLTSGKHHLEFDFGGEKAYAHNDAYVILGETGEVDISNFGWQTIAFTNSYSSTPIIIASPVTENADGGGDDENYIIPTIRTINNTHFEITLCQDAGASTCDSTYNTETVHYFVFDKDASLPSWIAIGNNTVDSTDNAATTLSWGKTFANNPLVFLQSQTYTQSGTNMAVRNWVSSITTTQASFKSCFHQGTGDACTSGMPDENIGWVAIDVANANFSGQVNFQSGSVTVNGPTWAAITWTANYTNPRMMVSMNGNSGGQDPKSPWAKDVDTTTPDVRQCEQDGANDCDNHNSNPAAWFTMEQGDITTGTGVVVDLIDPLSSFGTNPVNNSNESVSSVTFDFKTSDNIDIDYVQLFGNWSGGWHANYTDTSYTNNTYLNITVNNIPDGKYIWGVYSNDSTGNSDWTDTNRTFIVDTAAPTITLPFYENATIKANTETLTLNVSVSDATTRGNTCNIEANGTNITVAVSSGWCNTTLIPLTNLAEGNHTINVYANDSANNWGLNDSYVVKILNNVAPTIPFVQAVSTQNPLESGYRSVLLNFSVNDTNGASDINLSSARVQFNRTGEATRTNYTCANIGSGGNGQMFTCNISMWYYDELGVWTINVSARDNNELSTENSTTNFTYNLLTSMTLSPSALSWPSPINLTNTNISSDNNPITINNTGNSVNMTINITAYNLRGEGNTGKFIFADNFTIGNTTDGCGAGINASTMSNATSLQLNGTNFSKGNNTLNFGNQTSGQEQIFFCLKGLPQDATQQSYSSSYYGAWEIRILLVALIPRRRKKKKTKDNLLLKAANILAEDIKEKYSEEKEEILEILIKEVKKKYKLSKKEISKLEIRQEIKIPITIFSKEVGVLESLVKYMKQNLGMNYYKIAKLLDRDQRTIWTAYHKAIEKQKKPINIEESKIKISLTALRHNKLTILEAIVLYLKEKRMKFSEIAELLNRDQRNIWAVYSRANNKKISLPKTKLIKKKKMIPVKNRKGTQVLKLVTKELKEEYSKEKEIVILRLINIIRKEYKISKKDVLNLIREKEFEIPSMIFSRRIGVLESLTKYMKENLGMSYQEIAQHLNRDERTIWTAYHKAIEKQPEPIRVIKTEIMLQLIAFKKKLTMLESIILYLRGKELKYNEIAELLERDQRNIWTVYSRAKKKVNKIEE